MRINIQNSLRNAAGMMSGRYAGMYEHTMEQLVKHLKEVRDRHREGKSEEILNEFFGLYVFDDDQGKPIKKGE